MRSLANVITAERQRRGLTAIDLARLAGYKRAGKGAKRIERFESTSNEVRPFIERLFVALDVSISATEQQLALDEVHRKEQVLARWLLRHAQDRAPEAIVIRCFAACYARHRLPSGINTIAGALSYAHRFSHRIGLQVVVPVRRHRFVLFSSKGQVVSIGRS